jgi:hypothetical protein
MEFLTQLSKIINSGQSRSVVLTGNVNDLFFDGTSYVPLVSFLSKSYRLNPEGKKNGKTQLIYELNNSIRVVGDVKELSAIWDKYKGINTTESFQELCDKSIGNSTLALEFLRQLTVCSREAYKKCESHNDLLIIIEAADFLIPEEKISSMSLHDRRRIAIIQDWFADLDFVHGPDSVILITESKASLHSKISTLPQVLSVEIPYPNSLERQKFIDWFCSLKNISSVPDSLASNTAALSIYALRQLMCSDLDSSRIMAKVEEYIISQLGEDVVEFKKPTHKLDDVIGFTRVKNFIRNEMIPRIKGGSSTALTGAAVGGPIGGGKTFIFEALASELNLPVLVLKNLRSQWYGQTDVIFERLKRTLAALDKVVIFIDEADTQFGGVGNDAHETERRLTGKIQSMMSDPQLKGKVIWLLMTARIHLLSPDIRRPGRAGDLIIPILDPEGNDFDDFLKWTFKEWTDNETQLSTLRALTAGYSAASFAALKSLLKSKNCQSFKEVCELVEDTILPDIADAREFQTLQAKVNCTRQSLLFDKPLTKEELEKERKKWKTRLSLLTEIQ